MWRPLCPWAFAALIFAGCGPEEVHSILGTVWVTPCPPGPGTEECLSDALPVDCAELMPTWAQTPGEPLPEEGATLVLTGSERVTVSDRAGEFRFDDVPPGSVALSAAAPWTVELRQVQVADVVGSGSGPEPTEVSFSFTAAGALEGRVVLPRSPPGDNNEYGGLEAVEVQMACPPQSALTDATGRFRFDRVPVGTRQLTATGVGLVGTAWPQTVHRGQTVAVEIQLAYGRSPDQPGNSPPVMNGPIEMTPLADLGTTAGVTIIRPPAEALVRGQRVALTCSASDPDGDPLSYVWFASSGALEAGSSPQAVLTAGRADAGVSCMVLDGRGGVAATDRVIAVVDPYYAGAALFADGVVLSAAYAGEFDLVLWTPTSSRRLLQPGDQWLPAASGAYLAFTSRTAGVDTLLAGDILPTEEAWLAPEVVAGAMSRWEACDNGVAWVTPEGEAWFRDRGGLQTLLAPAPAPEAPEPRDLATSAGTVALGRAEAVELWAVSGAAPMLVSTLATPGRTPGALATDGTRVAYWADRFPILATEGAQLPLGSDQLPPTPYAVGRIALTPTHAAYSYYGSPLSFVEATVVRLQGDLPMEPQRAAVGPSEVLGLDGSRLLLGRARSDEDEPSADLWLVDLATLGVVP